MREVLKEFYTHVVQKDNYYPEYRTVHKYGSIPKSKVFEDNEVCLKCASLPKMSPITKHIDLPYHFFRSKVEKLEIKVLSIRADDQVVDQCTKGLTQDKFELARKTWMGW